MLFRDLRADEIECRIAMINENGVQLLLYKDARCDMNILDETVGPYNWQRRHCRENANCVVSIWDESKKQWIEKEDTGTESNTEKEKGLCSDSFKRSCVNWGIGRELYTAPYIWIKAGYCKKLSAGDNKKWKCLDKFSVVDIKIKDKRIVSLKIANLLTDRLVFVWDDIEYASKQKTPENGAQSARGTNAKENRASETKGNICTDCGAKVDDEYIIENSKKVYGRLLCKDCCVKERKRRKAAEQQTL